MTWTLHVGDVRTELQRLEEDSVHTVVTSPPYWQLRDYGAEGQIGLEETPEAFVASLVAVFREVRRVLRPDGTLWLNLGDTYIGGRTGGIGTSSTVTSRNHKAAIAAANASGRRHRIVPGLKPKDLVGIPWRVALALQADGWWLRSEVIWHKPCAMPESVRDRPTRDHEHIFLLSRSERYYYDAAAVKEPVSGGAHARGKGTHPKSLGAGAGVRANESWSAAVTDLVEERNRRTVWTVPQEPVTDAHFATFPRALVRPCVLAGCPAGGVVLDPFAGRCTTGAVAIELGRHFEGIEINPEYAVMGREVLRRAAEAAGQLGADADLPESGVYQLGLFAAAGGGR